MNVAVAGITLVTGEGWYTVNVSTEAATDAVLAWYAKRFKLQEPPADFMCLDDDPDVESFYSHWMPVNGWEV